MRDWSAGGCSADLIGAPRAFAGHAQRVDFGMRLAGPQMRALADHFAVANDDAADAGVWLRRVNAMLGEPQSLRHECCSGGRCHDGPDQLFLPRRRVAASASSNGNCDLRSSALGRSEEHTSELQSLMRISYAVFCLKKKKTIN